jgi:hypothetical protein
MFCGLECFGVGTFCSWDVIELEPFVLGRFVVGRFVLGCFVGAPYNKMTTSLFLPKAGSTLLVLPLGGPSV